MMASSVWVRRNCKNRTNTASNIPENTLKAFCNQQSFSWDDHRACIFHIFFYHAPLEPYSQHNLIQSPIAGSAVIFVQHTLSRLCGISFSTVSFPLPASFREMAFFLQIWLWVEECCLALLCAPCPYIIIHLLAYSEFMFYRLFFVALIFAQMLHVSMGSRLSNTIYCDSQISPQNLQLVWSHVLLAFSKDYFSMVWLSDGWK